MSALEDLLRLPHSERIFSARLQARDRATGQAVVHWVTSADELITEPEDEPPNQPHLSRLAPGWENVRQIGAQGNLGGSNLGGRSEPNFGELRLRNLDGKLTPWLELEWSGEPQQVLLGGRRRANGTPYPFAEFEPWFTGIAEDLAPEGQGELVLTLAGRKKLEDRPLVPEVYGGWGGALRLDPELSQWGSVAPDPVLDLPGEWTLRWAGVVRELPTARVSFLRKTGGASNYGLELREDGSIELRVGATFHRTPEAFPTGPHVLVAEAAGTTGRLWVDGALALEAEISEPAPSPGEIWVGRTGPRYGAFDLWELGIWGQAVGLELAELQGPVTDLQGGDLRALWKLEDFEGEEAHDEVGGLVMGLSGGPAFVASLEGDDPYTFSSASAIGRAKPLAIGPVRNVPLTLVDSPRLRWHWSRDPASRVDLVRVRGVPAVPALELQSTQVSFDAASSTLSAPDLDFSRVIPPQEDPPRPGQQVEVEGSLRNDGVLTVAQVLAEGLRVEEVLLDEGPGVAAEIRSVDPQYTEDLASATLSTAGGLGHPDGDITLDGVGWLSAAGTSRLTEVFAFLTGIAADASRLVWDPELGFWAPFGSSPSLYRELDTVLLSGLGWWAEGRGGDFSLGTYRPPGGEPVASFTLADIHAVRPGKSVRPYGEVRVGYARNWKEQQGDALAPAVSAAERQDLGQRYRWVDLPTVSHGRPLARTLELPTYLTRREDALYLAKLAGELHGERRQWYELDLDAFASRLEPGDLIYITYPGHGLAAGKLLRLVHLKERPAEDLVTLEAFG